MDNHSPLWRFGKEAQQRSHGMEGGQAGHKATGLGKPGLEAYGLALQPGGWEYA